jgi:hypothetical protein
MPFVCALGLGARVIDVLDRKIQLVLVPFGVAAELAAAVSRGDPVHKDLMTCNGILVRVDQFLQPLPAALGAVAIRREMFPDGNFPASALITVSNFATPGMTLKIQGVAVTGDLCSSTDRCSPQ